MMRALHTPGVLLTTTLQQRDDKVAYVPRAGGPPDTMSYMWAGYVIAAVVYGAYIVLLLRRTARVKAALRGAGRRSA
jgi:hypothetical protein